MAARCLFVCSGVAFALVMVAAPGQAGENLLSNGSFEVDDDGDGMADGWRFAGDAGVKVEWARDAGVEGRFCQRVTCTSFRQLSPASHVMLAQYDTFALQEGQWYRVSFWVKGEGIPGRAASVAVMRTDTWDHCGLHEGFRVTPQWRQRQFWFRSRCTLSSNLRFQIWFLGTGTIWVDDVRLEKSEAMRLRATEVLPDTGARNLVPNSSFECGTSGWGSIASLPGWGGSLNTLVGEIDRKTAAQHSCSFKIPLDRRTAPVFFFDYFEMYRVPVLAPMLANRGYFAVTPGAEYTLSAYVKADSAQVPCAMAVYQLHAGVQRKEVTAGTDWHRIAFTFRPSTEYIFVALGPDLSKTDLPRATLWIDGVQLERGASATEYEPRAAVEVGVEWDAPGHLFSAPAQARATVAAFNASKSPKTARVETTISDFYDHQHPGPKTDLTLPPNQGVRKTVPLPVRNFGFYRLHVASEAAAVIPVRGERFAVVRPYSDADSLFGMNHAYPWRHLNRLSKKIGLTWFRDWSLKWQHVEPEKGHFDFAEADYQINRVLADGLNVIGLLPFPSGEWSSSAPEDVPRGGWPGVPFRGAYMPRDLSEFADYVRATVRHYAGRIRVWEILNEPIYTFYALPRDHGYKVEDYVRLLEVAYRAVKEVAPKDMLIGGIAGYPDALAREFVAAGGLRWVDALNIHTYPGVSLPEGLEPGLKELVAAMDQHGGRKPLWDTEGAYYADDDPPAEPFKPFEIPLLDSEQECAAYLVRLDIILFSNGVAKFIYHSGTCGSLNYEDAASIFFEWDGAPRKMLATQAALAALLGPDTVALGAIREKPRAYAFRSRGKTVVAAWDENGGSWQLSAGKEARLLDIQGNELASRKAAVNETPCYLVFDGAVQPERIKTLLERWLRRTGDSSR